MRVVALLVVFFGGMLAAQKTGTILIDSGTEPVAPQVGTNLPPKPPEGCESKVYRWNRDGFECLRIDRIRILKSQRNLNMRALATCRQELTFMRAEKVLIAIHVDARRKCQKLGKVFDEEAVQCAGAIPRGDETK